MYCSNCGVEASGNFCFNCGAPLMKAAEEMSGDIEDIIEEIEADDPEGIYVEIDGVKVNLSEIIEACGQDRVAAIKILTAQTGVGLREGKAIIDEAYDSIFPPQQKKGFLQTAMEENAKRQLEKLKNEQLEKERIAQMDREGIVYCPKCHSTSLTTHKKGFGIGKAVVGAAALGPLGLIGGNIGAKKVRVTCMNCGNQFWAGKK